MKALRVAVFAAVLLSPVLAYAASVAITLVVPSTVSTAVTCMPVAAPSGPVAAGFAVCPIVVSPTGWAGSVALSDTVNFDTVMVSGQMTLVTKAALGAGSYPVTITTTP